jgi:uncharacterized protein (TIGR03437 family)
MPQFDTARRILAAALATLAAASAQAPAGGPDWRRIGNAALLMGLASPASAGVERVWFTPEGGLAVRLASGKSFVTQDFDSWVETRAAAPAATPIGAEWGARTSFRGQPLLGSQPLDVAAAANDPQRVAVATRAGVWVSADGGLSWRGVNEQLPNLQVRQILAAPAGVAGLTVVAESAAGPGVWEWRPGQRAGWSAATSEAYRVESALLPYLSAYLARRISATTIAGDVLYAGSATGELYSTADRGGDWQQSLLPAPIGAVQRIVADPADPNFAIAVCAPRAGDAAAPRVLRTLNRGLAWDDLTANLPPGTVYGAAFDRSSGALYVAAEAGVFLTETDLRAPVAATSWRALRGVLPEAPVRDVRLDAAGVVLYAALEGEGLFAASAPHRGRHPAVVNSADYARRPAAPGTLLSVVGARLSAAEAWGNPVPILAALDGETQIQVPFAARGENFPLFVTGASGRLSLPLPLRPAAPAILIDREGAPMLVDADTGVQLDALNPARGGARIQILASGLGRVTPDWPDSTPAPLDAPPRVAAAVSAALDGVPVEVTRATLAPGYIGYYLVEVQLPELVNAGPSELTLEAGGLASNAVRLYLNP